MNADRLSSVLGIARNLPASLQQRGDTDVLFWRGETASLKDESRDADSEYSR
jgi:hypothetical protein